MDFLPFWIWLFLCGCSLIHVQRCLGTSRKHRLAGRWWPATANMAMAALSMLLVGFDAVAAVLYLAERI